MNRNDEQACYEIITGIMGVYQELFAPLCKEAGLSHTAMGILMHLGPDGGCQTASDICSKRFIKPNIVSFNVDKLVNSGFVERQPISGDRRKIKLVPTTKALPVIEKGHKLKAEILSGILNGMTAEDLLQIHRYIETINKNVQELKEQSTKNTK